MCMKLRQTVSRNVWWWQSNRGLCSTMWSGCWGKLTGNSIIGRLPPLNGNGDDDGYISPHHNNAVLPHHLDLGIELPPTPHVGPLSIFICNLPRNQIIEPMQLNFIFFYGFGEGSNLNGENYYYQSVVPMMTTALLSSDSKLNYWREVSQPTRSEHETLQTLQI